MFELLLQLDRDLLLAVNSCHTPWLDSLMMWLTRGITWLPLFVPVAGSLLYRYGVRSWPIWVGLLLTILVTDQVSSSLLKPWVGRLRPSHTPELATLLHLVDGYRGGLYSFVSSHAANSFGAAMFLWLTVRKEIGWIGVMFAWALIFSFTRLYLGVHYPSDILAGGLLGILVGWCLYRLGLLLPARFPPAVRDQD